MSGEKTSITRIASAFFFVFLLPGAIGAQEADLARGIRAYTDADYRAAIAVLESLDESKLRPDEQVAQHKFLALSLIARKQLEQAQENFIKLLAIEPDYKLIDEQFSPSVLELFQKSKIAQGARLCDRGVEAYNAGKFKEAVPDLEQALQLNPRDIRANEFLRLVSNRLREEDKKSETSKREQCVPSRAWGELEARTATCKGVDYSTNFELPAQANRVTLIYSKHYFGLGACWKIVLYDTEGKEVLVLEDPSKTFKGKQRPGDEDRWLIVNLPEVRTIAQVKMYGEGGHGFEKFMGQRVGKDLADELILSLEVTCLAEASVP